MTRKHIGLFILLITITSDAMTSQARGVTAPKPKPAASQVRPTTPRATTASLPDQYVNKYISNPTTAPKTLPEVARDKIQMVLRKTGDALTGISWAERLRPLNSLENYSVRSGKWALDYNNLPKISQLKTRRYINSEIKWFDIPVPSKKPNPVTLSRQSEYDLKQAEATFNKLPEGATESQKAKAYNDFHKAQKAIAKRENINKNMENNAILKKGRDMAEAQINSNTPLGREIRKNFGIKEGSYIKLDTNGKPLEITSTQNTKNIDVMSPKDQRLQKQLDLLNAAKTENSKAQYEYDQKILDQNISQSERARLKYNLQTAQAKVARAQNDFNWLVDKQTSSW